MSYESVPRWLKQIPEHFKTVEMCNETVAQFSYALEQVPGHLKMAEMCTEAVCNNVTLFFLVPNNFKTEEMCIKALEVDPWQLYDISDYLKTQKMCDKAAKDDPSSLQFLPDWFVTQQQMDVWYDDKYWDHDDEIIQWCKSYKKRKAQKAKIKEELLPIAWNPNRVMDWCMSEDEKRWWK